MNKWAFLLGAVAAVGAVVVVVSLAARRSPGGREEVPELIEDCFERIHHIEAELRRLHAGPETAG